MTSSPLSKQLQNCEEILSSVIKEVGGNRDELVKNIKIIIDGKY